MSTGTEATDTERNISKDSNNSHTCPVEDTGRGFCSVRHGLAFIFLLCNFSISTQQLNMNIAILAMVNHTAPTSHTNASTESSPADSQDYENGILNGFKAVAPVYDWSPEIQGIILSSLNYGSLLTPLLVGYVAGIFGVKHVVDAGLLICSALNLFIPLAADTGVTLLIVIRIVQGIAQVMVLTGQYSIWTKWAPSLERSQLITTALSGIMLGNFIIFALGGLLCQTIGWPYVFYIFGGIGCVCCALCFLLVYDDPLHHPFISTDEKMYIQRALAEEVSSPGWSLPIKAMIKSLPLWAILVSAFCQSWAYLTMATHTPIYIRSVLHVNIRDVSAKKFLGFF